MATTRLTIGASPPLEIVSFSESELLVLIEAGIMAGTMGTGTMKKKVHTEPAWAYGLTEQAHVKDIPVFMKEDLVPIIGEENMIQELPAAFNQVLEEQKKWNGIKEGDGK